MELLKRLNKLAQTARAGWASPTGPGTGRLLGGLRKRRAPAAINPSPASLKVYRAVIARKVSLIDRLPSRYRQDVCGVVWNAVMAGYDEAALADALHDRFGIARERAGRIARSQCTMARSIIEHAALVEAGVKEAAWHYADKHCPVKSHAALAGRHYVVTVGAVLDGKRVWPGSEPTCICTSRRIDAADEEAG